MLRKTLFRGILACTLMQAQPSVRWKVLVDDAAEKSTMRAAEQPRGIGRGHSVVEFGSAPSAGDLDALRVRGVSIVAVLPDNAVLVSAARELELDGLGLNYAGPLDARRKLSPLLADTPGDEFVVEFHPDVNMNDARARVLAHRLELRENPDLGEHRLLVRRVARARAADPLPGLAAEDAVAYIFPASEELVRGIPVTPCVSAVAEGGLGPIGQYIATVGNGWDGPGLGAADLAYVWGAATTKLPAAQAQAEILRAMNEWSRVAAIRWSAGTNAAGAKTVHVLFGRGNHGDAYPFDGRGSVLAHTFYPSAPNPEPIAGDMHLDDDEAWRVGANTDLYSVALHELGHALGLGHSDDPTAVMYPYYRMASSLQADDRVAILRLYAVAGTASSPAPNPTPSPAPPPAPNPADRTAPALTILNPASSTISTTAASRTISGTASDAGGLASVTWVNSLGGSGTASGTANWSATIPLVRGYNRITVRATDLAGNTSWRTVTITRL